MEEVFLGYILGNKNYTFQSENGETFKVKRSVLLKERKKNNFNKRSTLFIMKRTASLIEKYVSVSFLMQTLDA